MNGADTNILVRLVLRDDPDQFRRASEIVRSAAPLWINRVVLAELVWVLSRAYSLDKTQIQEIVGALLGAHEFVVEDAALVRAALKIWNASNADFADILISETNRAAGCETTFTLDKAAARTEGFTSI